MPKSLKLAEVFPPGEYLLDELTARGWSRDDLAEVMGRPLRTVNDLINGRRGITAELALELEAALGISAQLWMGMDAEYRLWKAEPPPVVITRRAARKSTQATGSRSA